MTGQAQRGSPLQARVLGPAIIAVACTVAAALSLAGSGPTTTTHASERPPATPEALALLGGLAPGDTLVGWTVERIDGPQDSELRVVIARDDVRFALVVTRQDPSKQPPPAMTEHYAIYYGHAQPPDTRLPQGTVRATTHALARRIAEHEHEIAVPEL